MKRSIRVLLAAVFAGLLVSGCASTPEDTGVTADREPGAGAETGVVDDQVGFQGDPLDDPQSPLAQRLIYFDFDRSDIRPEFLDVLSAHAQYLVDRPNAQVRLEGHTDERGSREYNIGLGDRRAQSVRRILLFQGVANNQVSTVSYGEERPAAQGQNEDAWAQNRRVELVYSR